ncbi:MAG: hypothetical protein IPP56_15105 [Bacteroidetes bacterium]|nr:hypothetical protein [Bacteroidota bacterium]MBK9672915.1 hypothetical protein [Bacteroidota bacterium]MBK9800988.1 hypothetical protein [Bacteroidota bacterium]MBP6413430.1 hypothetical protein [Bacteroidia bacterium]
MHTEFHLLGIKIYEPVTAFTDFILAVLCLLFYFRYTSATNEKGIVYWKRFFLYMGLSTLIGGFTHALFENPSNKAYIISWLSMQLCSGLSVYQALMATIFSISNPKIPIYKSAKKSIYLCQLQFIIFCIATIYFQNFLVVVINSTIGFLLVLYIHALSGKKYGNKSASWIALGITVSFLTAFVYAFEISINAWFNFKDIAHVIMAISIIFISIGVGKSYSEVTFQESKTGT